MRQLLLCSDLDRTILPNGAPPESPRARPLLHTLANRPEVTLAYVSGRHLALLREAIARFAIPVPNYAIGDVGTTIYEVHGKGDWRPWHEWSEEIAPDWDGACHADLSQLFCDLDVLRLQEKEKQNTFKLSFYTPQNVEREPLLAEMDARLQGQGVRASLIWSVDEAARVGLLDVLPASATKLHAVRFLMERKGFADCDTVFAGDSGNDLPVLTSGLQSVLVRNAHREVRDEAFAMLAPQGLSDRLYVAAGGWLGMNGNYSAGVLEGVVHFFPEAQHWLTA
ncbi:MAG: HAD-IIB family hydrolase [Pseudomonadota bacterium]|nr:MAG: HAD-IIB family hydrolase [Pseudomonadota bacterium]